MNSSKDVIAAPVFSDFNINSHDNCCENVLVKIWTSYLAFYNFFFQV